MMKKARTYFHPLFTLAVASVLSVGQAIAAQVEFDSPDYANGDLTNNAAWNGEGGNIVSTAAAGYGGALGIVTLSPTSVFTECVYTNPVNLNTAGDTVTLSSRFRYSTTGFAGSSNADLFSLMVFDDPAINTNGFVRLGLRRDSLTEVLTFFMAVGPGPTQSSESAESTGETNVGLPFLSPGTSDWLELTASLTKGTSSNDWFLTGVLSNLTTTNLVLSTKFSSLEPLPTFQDDPAVYGSISSSATDADSAAFDRSVDNFCITSGFVNLPVPILLGSLGNADFEDSEVPGSPGTVTGAITYSNTVHWHNGQGPETINFTQDSQMGGSTQSGSRGGMPFQDRLQVNDTGYVITSAGEVFSLSYDFGAGGNPAHWTTTADQTMRTFLFTSTAPVDGNLTDPDITILGGDNYPIDLAGDGQWTSRSVDRFYVAKQEDVGETVYFGMKFDRGTGANNLFPRIDVIQLSVLPGPAPVTVIGGAAGNGNFNSGIPTGPPTTNVLTFAGTANWHFANGGEGTNFVFNSLMGGSSDPNSGGGYVFQNRLVVNDAGYTITDAGQTFILSYEFGAGGNQTNAYGNDEFLRAYLFTANAPVDGNLTNGNMTQVSGNDDYFMDRLDNDQWTAHYQPSLYTTVPADIGKTVYLAVQFNNPVAGATLPDPRLENVVLCVTEEATACATPTLSIVQNGSNVDVSWTSESGCDYQVQTNSTINGTWGDYGLPAATNTVSIPISGDELYIRVEAQ